MSLMSSDTSFELLTLIPGDDCLRRLAAEGKTEYSNGLPYPHIAFDNFLPEDVAQAALDAFPGPEDVDWIRFKNAREIKLSNNQEAEMPPVIRNVLYALNSATFLRFLEELTGIQGLIPDPEFVG